MKKSISNFRKSMLIICGIVLTLSLQSCSKEKTMYDTTWKGRHSEVVIADTIQFNYDLTLMFSEDYVNIDMIVEHQNHLLRDTSFTVQYTTGKWDCEKKDITLSVDGKQWTGTFDKTSMNLSVTIHDTYLKNTSISFKKQ